MKAVVHGPLTYWVPDKNTSEASMIKVEKIKEDCQWEGCEKLAHYFVRQNEELVGQFCRDHAEAKRRMLQIEEDASKK